MTLVTGTYLAPDDTPAQGRITFSLNPSALDLAGNQRTTGPVIGTLDPSGSFSVDLIPDPELIVDGQAQYLVTEQISGIPYRNWYLWVDLATGEIDLPSRYPGTVLAPGAVTPVPGAPGLQGEVSVAATVTGAPGTQAAVTDSDPSPGKAVLTFTIPRGDVGATGPAIGALLTTKGDVVARDASNAVRVPIGTNGQSLTADSTATPGVAWRTLPVGNLLTDNQASGTDTLGTTTPWTASSGNTIASSSAQAAEGSKSLLVTMTTANSTANINGPGAGTAGVPVVPLGTYSYVVSLRSSVNITQVHQRVWWYKTDGSASATPTVDSAMITIGPAGWTNARLTMTAPADAAFCNVGVKVWTAVAIGDAYYADRFGLWRGSGGDWAMPGTPITGTQQAWETVATLADLPATGNWLGRRIQVTAGLGLQVMVWTGAAWVVDPVSDTGWQTLTPPAGNVTSGTVRIRRRGNDVLWSLVAAIMSAGSGTIAFTQAQGVGWRVETPTDRAAWGERVNATTAYEALLLFGNQLHWQSEMNVLVGTCSTVRPTSGGINAVVVSQTADAWPTVAPT